MQGLKVFVTIPSEIVMNVFQSSQDFRKWNAKNKVCYFSTDKKLSFFKHYSQDNCLLECRLKKITKICGCTPWYLKQENYQICTHFGNICLEKQLSGYSDDLKDRTECDCLNDCEMVHFFSTMQREPYSDQMTETRPQKWFDYEGGKTSGILANYLMDPEHVFSSPLVKNVTKLAHNLSHDYELAQKRFDEVI